MRPEKQIISTVELGRMLAKHSGEHGEKCTTYGAVLILIALGALLSLSPVLWFTSQFLLAILLPIACIIMALAALKALFNFIIERLPSNNGAGR